MMELMAFALIVAQIALIGALLAFTFKSVVTGVSFGFDVPFVKTPRAYFPLIAEALDIHDDDVVYDLGCGDGSMLLYLARQFPRARFIGIERNFFLHMQSLVRKKIARISNVEFRREDFFATDMQSATRIYAYLLPQAMDRLFARGVHKGIRVVSRAFEIPNVTPLATIELTKKKGWHNQHLLHVYEL